MSTHLRKVHPTKEDNWLESLLDLEGLMVNSEERQRRVAQIKGKPAETDDSDYCASNYVDP